MYISKLNLVNYRNFSNTKLIFSDGINTIIGENGSGKTNLFRAIRLLLDDSMRRSALNLDEIDFCRDLKDWRGHWIIISLEFDAVSADEAVQSLFLHGAGIVGMSSVSKATYNLIFRPKTTIRTNLSLLPEGDKNALNALLSTITIDDYETIVTGKSNTDFNDIIVYKKLVGDFENVVFSNELNPAEIGWKIPPILSMAKEISFTFVQALRDVVSDFHNNRTNPLSTLLKSKSGQIGHADFEPIAQQVQALNSAIESLNDVTDIKNDIEKTINDTVGDAYSPNSMSIKSDLSDEAEHLFRSLKLFISESDDGYEGAIHEMSLGGANLIYLTLKLLEFKYQKANQAIANFLLIEEPEAHIHTHIQKSLFDKLRYSNTQIIYSTHSSHISEVSNIRNVNVLGKVDGKYEAFQPAAGLTNEQSGFVQRYLDAIRSNLLFAKSVILVEGDAEEILIPTLIKNVLGVSLDELGISLVNIRSTGFENIAMLFHDDRIRKKCSIITDLDETFFDTTEVATDSNELKSAKKKAKGSKEAGIARKAKLDAFCIGNQWIKTFYAPHTFEVDLIASGNSKKFIKILNQIYTDAKTIATSTTDLESTDITVFGKRALRMANHSGKGWFAIILGNAINSSTRIPDYIIDAVFFAHGHISSDVLSKILNYRINKIIGSIKKQERKYVDTIDLEANPEESENVSLWIDHISATRSQIVALKQDLTSFRAGTLDLNQIRMNMRSYFPDDNINPILAKL